MISRNSCSSTSVRDDSGRRVPELTNCSNRSINSRTSMISPPCSSARQPTGNWRCFATTGELLPERIRDKVRYEPLGRSTELDDLLDQAGTQEAILQAGHQEDLLDLRRHLSIHQCHLSLDFEIGDGSQSSNDHLRTDLAREVDQQAVELLDLEIRNIRERL